MFTEQLTDLLVYINNLPRYVCLVGDMNIHFDNPLKSLTKQTLNTHSLYNLVQVINKHSHMCGHIIIIIIMVIYKCYFSGEHIALSINKNNNNGVNIELGKTNRLNALCMMQINT